MRKILGAIGGLVVAYVLHAFLPHFEGSLFLFKGLWWICAIAAPSGITVGLIADNRYWIPGSVVGIAGGAFMLILLLKPHLMSQLWVPTTDEYVQVVAALLCPVLFAELTGRAIEHIRARGRNRS